MNILTQLKQFFSYEQAIKQKKQRQIPELIEIGIVKPVCPYCGTVLDKKPGRKKKCPDCSADFLVEKTTKKKGTYLLCANKDCGYEETH